SKSMDQCALDWHVHQETTMVDPLNSRKRKAVMEIEKEREYSVSTGKPYTLEEFKTLLEKAAKWEKIPSNRKLFALYTALCRGPEATRETLKYIFLRRENETGTFYRPLWDAMFAINGDYPLWQETNYGENLKIYHSEVADQLELRWLMQGPVAGERND
ncbi:MAG: hypothetical protein J7M20_03290, partial [Deltaproteobacteria bacterium]|nr:hypothetical protein [Deltaproteobacteria bacterium]